MGDAERRAQWAIDIMNLTARMHIAEIGCGDGKTARLLCAQFPSVHLLAIDRSPTAVAKAKKNLQDHENARVRQQALEHGAFEGEKFDVIFSAGHLASF